MCRTAAGYWSKQASENAVWATGRPAQAAESEIAAHALPDHKSTVGDGERPVRWPFHQVRREARPPTQA
jgi:hypothetical protein